MCNEAIAKSSYALRYVPDYLKTQEMCKETVSNNPAVLFLVPDHLKTQGMCNEALEVNPWSLYDIPITLRHKKYVMKPLRQTLLLCSLLLIGLLLNNNKMHGLMTTIGITMMILLSGTKVIKNEKLKKQKLRKS